MDPRVILCTVEERGGQIPVANDGGTAHQNPRHDPTTNHKSSVSTHKWLTRWLGRLSVSIFFPFSILSLHSVVTVVTVTVTLLRYRGQTGPGSIKLCTNPTRLAPKLLALGYTRWC